MTDWVFRQTLNTRIFSVPRNMRKNRRQMVKDGDLSLAHQAGYPYGSLWISFSGPKFHDAQLCPLKGCMFTKNTTNPISKFFTYIYTSWISLFRLISDMLAPRLLRSTVESESEADDLVRRSSWNSAVARRGRFSRASKAFKRSSTSSNNSPRPLVIVIVAASPPRCTRSCSGASPSNSAAVSSSVRPVAQG